MTLIVPRRRLYHRRTSRPCARTSQCGRARQGPRRRNERRTAAHCPRPRLPPAGAGWRSSRPSWSQVTLSDDAALSRLKHGFESRRERQQETPKNKDFTYFSAEDALWINDAEVHETAPKCVRSGRTMGEMSRWRSRDGKRRIVTCQPLGVPSCRASRAALDHAQIGAHSGNMPSRQVCPGGSAEAEEL
jgi:hypothetical protein